MLLTVTVPQLFRGAHKCDVCIPTEWVCSVDAVIVGQTRRPAHAVVQPSLSLPLLLLPLILLLVLVSLVPM
jgi:hypothetical protein